MTSLATETLGIALVDALGEEALDALVDRLMPRIETHRERRTSEEPDDGWMTTAEAATYLGMTVNALHKLTAARAIPFSQAGPSCRCYFKRSALDSWRNGNRANLS